MANGHDDTLMKRVPTYGTGDPGRVGAIPMMSMVALKVIKVSESRGGLVLPESAQDQYQTPKCEVLAVGPQVLFTKVGDLVYIPAETIASKVWVGDATWIQVREDQIYAIDRGANESEFVRGATREKIASAATGKAVK